MELPSLNLKQWLGITTLVLLTGVGSFLSAKHFFPRVEQVEIGQKQIDENTWVKRTKYENQRTINKQLENTNEELSSKLNELGERVETLTSVNAKLNLKVDSLASNEPDTVELEGNVKDTTAVFTKTFGDSLFQVYSEVSIMGNKMTNYLGLKQLRPIQIDIAQTELNERIYISSPDLDSVKIGSITQAKRPKYSRGELFIGGVAIGALTTTTLILILGR